MGWLRDALRDIWNKCKDAFKGWFDSILEIFEKWFNQILDFIWAIVKWVVQLVWDFCIYLYDLFLGEEGLIWYMMDWLLMWGGEFLQAMPDIGGTVSQFGSSFSFVMQLVGRLNQFFPVMESVMLLFVYLGFLVVYILVKIVLKVLPGMGG